MTLCACPRGMSPVIGFHVSASTTARRSETNYEERLAVALACDGFPQPLQCIIQIAQLLCPEIGERQGEFQSTEASGLLRSKGVDPFHAWRSSSAFSVGDAPFLFGALDLSSTVIDAGRQADAVMLGMGDRDEAFLDREERDAEVGAGEDIRLDQPLGERRPRKSAG